MSRGLLSLALVALLLQVAYAQDNSVLNNKDGTSPCALKETLQEPCGGSSRRSLHLSRRDIPPANSCTCTNVFWNVWSACLAGKGQQMEPSSDWETQCRDQGGVKTQTPDDVEERVKRLNIPSWAFETCPQNKTFNVERAVLDAVKISSHSLTVKIVTPIVTVLGVLVACIIGFITYRRWRRRRGGAPNRLENLWETLRKGIWAPKIRKGTRRQSWQIDGRRDSDEFELVLPKSSSPTGATVGEHTRLSSSPPPMEPSSSIFSSGKSQAETHIPGKAIWKKSQLAQRLRRRWLLLRVPFKDSPVPVNSAPPSRSFNIDESNKSIRTNSTLENYRRGGFRKDSNPLTPTIEGGTWDYSHNSVPEEDEGDTDSDLGLGDRPDDFEDENESLMSAGERQRRKNLPSVLIIGRSNNHASMESGQTSLSMQVDPPSPVRSSPGPPPSPPPRISASHSRAGSSSRYGQTPPAPDYPPPMPPLSPRYALQDRRQSIESILEPPVSAAPTALSSASEQIPGFDDITIPTPLYMHRQQSSSTQNVAQPPPRPPGIPHQISSSSLDNGRHALPLPPSLRPAVSQQPFRSTEQLTLNANDSSSNLSGYSLLVSPPYRPRPLPEEMTIARGDSPFPLHARTQSVDRPEEMSPPYRSKSPPIPASPPAPGHSPPVYPRPHGSNTGQQEGSRGPGQQVQGPTQNRRELPRPPQASPPHIPHHHRVLSDPVRPHSPFMGSIDAAAGERTAMARRVSSESTATAMGIPAADDVASLFPGAVRAAGYAPAAPAPALVENPSSDSLQLLGAAQAIGGGGGRPSNRDPRWYPEPSSIG
ncbi:hypothetical protein PQX77_006988 [Marasmius sp. AFHP31]|nr:hypothetical protein PQX77_006988 [Marasmius sp. AFHP31]